MPMLLLGNWQVSQDAQQCWQPPDNCLGAVDLASAAQIASAKPGQPRGVGIFVCTEIPAGWDGAVLASGDPRDAKPDASIISAWKSLTGYQPSGDTLADCLWNHLTLGADPNNQSACGVLMPDADGTSNLWLGNRIARKPFDLAAVNAYASSVRQVLRQQLADAKADSLAGKLRSPVTGKPDLRYYLKIADALCDKFAGKNPAKKAALLAAIKPASFDKADVLVPHETTLTESFTAANGTLITALAAGWINDVEDIAATVQSNRCQSGAAGGGSQNLYRHPSALSSADHYTQCNIYQRGSGSSASNLNACIVRKAASSTRTYYYGGLHNTAAVYRLYKVVGGVMTQLGSDASVTVSLPQLAYLSASGSTLTGKYAGSTVITLTDTSITGNLSVGWRVNVGGTATIIDDWEAGDLGGGGGIVPSPYYWLMMGAGNL